MMTAIRAFLLLSASLIVGGVTGAQVRSPALTIVSPQEAAFVAGRTLLRARMEPAAEAISVIWTTDDAIPRVPIRTGEAPQVGEIEYD